MPSLALAVGVLAGVLATGLAALADPTPTVAPDRVRAAATTEQTRPANTASPPSAAPEPASAAGSDDIIPVGFGWG